MVKPVLVTLTAQSCGGKSYLFNYIRDVAKLPCLISTTTRAPRDGEQEGVDYFFITKEESIRLEKEGQFAELAIYNGHRYGVTKDEFHSKLNQGIAFLIVEPGGIEHYAKPAVDAGAMHYKTFIFSDPAVRLERFMTRSKKDMMKALSKDGFTWDEVVEAQRVALSRLTQMLTTEVKWFEMAQWDRVLQGDWLPEENLKAILHDIEKIRSKE